MDRIEQYKQYIQTILIKHAKYKPNHSDINSELIFDTTHNHYQLMRVGWDGLKRIHHTVIHFHIKNNKIWIQQNMTDVDLAQELVEMGVPVEDIVLGLQPPYKRPYTGYGVA